METIRVRIAVVLATDSAATVWSAKGECGHTDEDVLESLKVEPGETVVWVEADVPIPTVVQGTVKS